MAIQGVLLNVFRAAWFARIAGCVQGLAITLMLVLIVLSFSIGPATERKLLQPEIAKWLPPVWFLGLYQKMLGDPDPRFQHLANESTLGIVRGVCGLPGFVSCQLQAPSGTRCRRRGIPGKPEPAEGLGP